MKIVKLGDVLEKTSTIKWKEQPQGNTYLYVDLTSVDRSKHEITQTSEINAKNAPSRAQKIIKTGDILFGTTRPTLNRLCIVPKMYDEQICSTGFCVLRANTELITPSFVYYLLTTKSFVEYIEATQRGTSYPAVTDKDVKQFEFVLPPIEEQQRIVARLDAAFEKIDRAIELTERSASYASLLLRNFLTNLYDSVDTEKQQLGNCIETFITGPFGSALHKSDYVPAGVPVVNPQNIQGGEIHSLNKMMVSNETAQKLDRYRLKIGDIVIARRGEMGRCAVVSQNQEGWICGTGCFVLRLRIGYDPEYIAQALRIDATRKVLEDKAVGTTMLNLNQSLLLGLVLPVPSLKEQMLVIQKSIDMKHKITNVSGLYETKIKNLAILKESLLTRAFSQGGVQ